MIYNNIKIPIYFTTIPQIPFKHINTNHKNPLLPHTPKILNQKININKSNKLRRTHQIHHACSSLMSNHFKASATSSRPTNKTERTDQEGHHANDESQPRFCHAGSSGTSRFLI